MSERRANQLLREYAQLWDVRVFIPLHELAPTIIRGATCDERMLRIVLYEFHSWAFAEDQLTLKLDRLREKTVAQREARIKELEAELATLRGDTAPPHTAAGDAPATAQGE